jgi:transcriptional regulator
MYDLPYFKEKDEKVIRAFIDDHPFAYVSGCDAENKPVATQVPVFIEEENGRKVLRGHIMKNTDHHKAFLHNPSVLVVFSGHHTYVSATWYSDPKQASTWNYMSVHAKGTLHFLDEKGLIEVLKKTSMHFENYNKESTTIFDNLPKEYTDKLIKAIVAFEIEIKELSNVFKLSQNRDPHSYENIKEKLQSQGGDAAIIAAEMEKRTRELFPDKEKWDGDKFLS